ncbi:MAG: GerAB/ArcD/ProY family transporter [Eubacteriales bacterium]
MTESVSRRKAAFAGVLCLINANYIRGGVYASGQDAWIAAAASTLLLLPVAGWFTWLIRRYPDKTLFAILHETLPRWAAALFSSAAVLYALLVAVITASNFSIFVQSNILADTPRYFITALLLAAALMLCKTGARTFSQWCVFVFPAVLVLILILTAFAVPHFDWANLRPAFREPAGLLEGTVRLFVTSLGMLLFLFSLFAGTQHKKGEMSPFFASVIGSGALLTAVFLANTLIFPEQVSRNIRYITYYTASVVGFGDFFQHIEIFSAFVYQCTSIAALTVILSFLCQGLESLFSLSDARVMAAPLALFIYAVSLNLLYSSMEAPGGSGMRWYGVLLPAVLLIPAAASLPGRRLRRSTRGG